MRIMTDAQKRLEHDQNFPDEPKQIWPGEDVHMTDGKVQVSGQIAVMSINERLLQALMAKNPDVAFALQESFPLRGTYADALPLGPLMELRAKDEQNTFTADRATQYMDYWRNAAQQVMTDPEAAGSPAALKSLPTRNGGGGQSARGAQLQYGSRASLQAGDSIIAGER